MKENFNLKAFVMDVDGTLTDGKIYISAEGELMKAFNIKDGYAIVSARKDGIIPIIITGRDSAITARRCEELGIKHLYQGVSDKLTQLKKVADKLNISLSEIAYIGDDLNDLECMQACGFSACPADAVVKVKNAVNYVCQTVGGQGAVREMLEQFIEIN